MCLEVAESVTGDKPFEWVIAYKERLLKMFKRVAKGDPALAEEMYSDVAVCRIHRLFELHDGVRPLENYIMRNLRWYAIKYRDRREYLNSRQVSIDITTEDSYRQADPIALDYLEPTEQWLIRAKYEWRLTVNEAARMLNWPVNKVKSSLAYTEAKVWHHNIHPDWFFVKIAITRMVQYGNVKG